ncbi:MAG: rod shape-determining protein MreD [Alphaproteobacteria bacterium]
MKSSITSLPQRVERSVRFALVYSLVILLWVMDVISLGVPEFQTLKPSFFLVALFYWSIYRPTLLPSWLVFLAGLVLDLITGLPVGLNAFLFVIIQRILIDQRLTFTGQPFTTVFFGYLIVSSLYYAIQWGIFGLVQQGFIDIHFVAGRIIMANIFFPVFYLLTHITHKVLPYEKRSEAGGIGKLTALRR